MSKLADALEVLLTHSSIPQESEARDAVQAAIDEQRETHKPKTTTKTETKAGGSQ